MRRLGQVHINEIFYNFIIKSLNFHLAMGPEN